MPPTKGTCEWYSIDPRNNNQVYYGQADTDKLEQSFKNGDEECSLSLGGNPFRVVFRDMMQYNATGGARQVVRNSSEPDVPLVELSNDLVECVRRAVNKMDDFVHHVETKVETDASARARGLVSPLTPQEVQATQAVFQHIINDFNSSKYKGKYNFSPAEDSHILQIRAGSNVPSYFANARGQSIFHRKFLSLLGLRNLIDHGVTIFSQMLAKVFHGDVSVYSGNQGPALMKQLTGNVVDLDSVVLRCSDPQVVSVINASIKKSGDEASSGAPAGGFRSGDELAKSTHGKRIAFESSSHLINEFIARFKLSRSEIEKRRIALPTTFSPNEEVPVATDNNARSKWPMWLYNNVGVITFHANVPTMADVYGALLRSPFHFVQAYLLARQQNCLDAFFEEALSDSCFNMKWKAIEEFLQTKKAVGSIVNVLNELHKSRADIFTNEFYDSDDEKGTNELAVMQRLVATGKLQGRDESTGKTRAVTGADVKAWHDKLMEVN